MTDLYFPTTADDDSEWRGRSVIPLREVHTFGQLDAHIETHTRLAFDRQRPAVRSGDEVSAASDRGPPSREAGAGPSTRPPEPPNAHRRDDNPADRRTSHIAPRKEGASITASPMRLMCRSLSARPRPPAVCSADLRPCYTASVASDLPVLCCRRQVGYPHSERNAPS